MKPDITDAEMDVLKALWNVGRGTVRDIDDRLPAKRPRAYTTLQTLLKRLEDKGVVTREKDQVPHVYVPLVSRQSLMKTRLKSLAEELCDGALGPLAMALVEKNNFSEDELQSFRELIDKLDREGS